MRLSTSLSTLSLLGSVNSAAFKDCGSTVKGLKFVISKCPDPNPLCVFASGETATIVASFTSPTPFKSAAVKLSGVIGPLRVPFPLEPSDACGKWGLRCPSAPGAHQTLKIDIPIQKQWPTAKVGVELQLIGDAEETLICTTFPVEIK